MTERYAEGSSASVPCVTDRGWSSARPDRDAREHRGPACRRAGV